MTSAPCSGICFLMVTRSQVGHVSSRDTECSVATTGNNKRLPFSCTCYKFTVKEFKQLSLFLVHAKKLFPVPWYGTRQLHTSSLSWSCTMLFSGLCCQSTGPTQCLLFEPDFLPFRCGEQIHLQWVTKCPASAGLRMLTSTAPFMLTSVLGLTLSVDSTCCSR